MRPIELRLTLDPAFRIISPLRIAINTGLATLVLGLLCSGLACAQEPEPSPEATAKENPNPVQPPGETSTDEDEGETDVEPPALLGAGWKRLGPALWFQPEERRLVIESRVTLRKGSLEHLLCLTGTKEHEAILASPAVPYQIHSTLLLLGAEAGTPVEFRPEFKPPTGDPIRVLLKWTDAENKAQTVDARTWILDPVRKQTLKEDWVFAGSEFFVNPFTERRVYAAEEGDLITVANFRSAILDVPFASTADDAALVFEAYTERIPPDGTEVLVELIPIEKAGKTGEDAQSESGDSAGAGDGR